MILAIRCGQSSSGRPKRGNNRERASRIGRFERPAAQCDAFVRAEVVDDLDAVPLLIGLDHHGRERRRARADAAQARQVHAVQQRFVLQQQHQHCWRRNRVLRLLLRDLLQIDGQLERVMQHERAGGAQPAHEATAESRHVHERKWIEQPIAGADLRAVEVTQAAGDPVVVRAWHALRHAFGAGGPADRHDIVGMHARREFERSRPRRIHRTRFGRERPRAFRRVATEHEHLRPISQRRCKTRVIRSLERLNGEQRARLRELAERLELAATELHRHRTDDDTEPRAREIHGNVFDYVRELSHQHVVASHARHRRARPWLRRRARRVSANRDVAARRRRAQRDWGGLLSQYAPARRQRNSRTDRRGAAPTTRRSRDIRSRDAAESCASAASAAASAQTTGGRFNWK